MKAPNLHCARKRLPRLDGHGIFLLADTLREWKKSDTQRNGKREKVGLQRSNLTDEAGKRHRGRPIPGAKQRGKELENSGNYEKHSRLKQHGNKVRFHVTCSHGEIVPAIELHKR